MTDLKSQFVADRQLRDAAKSLVMADYAQVKSDLSQRGVGARAVDRLKDSATDVYEEALEVADNHKGALGALVAAVAIWFARNPILSLFGYGSDETGDEGYDDAHHQDDEFAEHRRFDRRFGSEHHH